MKVKKSYTKIVEFGSGYRVFTNLPSGTKKSSIVDLPTAELLSVSEHLFAKEEWKSFFASENSKRKFCHLAKPTPTKNKE
tara:strand:- start:494 stop:733 length:240 start_codon:yes stop_codon:yes gene_type:complete